MPVRRGALAIQLGGRQRRAEQLDPDQRTRIATRAVRDRRRARARPDAQPATWTHQEQRCTTPACGTATRRHANRPDAHGRHREPCAVAARLRRSSPATSNVHAHARASPNVNGKPDPKRSIPKPSIRDFHGLSAADRHRDASSPNATAIRQLATGSSERYAAQRRAAGRTAARRRRAPRRSHAVHNCSQQPPRSSSSTCTPAAGTFNPTSAVGPRDRGRAELRCEAHHPLVPPRAISSFIKLFPFAAAVRRPVDPIALKHLRRRPAADRRRAPVVRGRDRYLVDPHHHDHATIATIALTNIQQPRTLERLRLAGEEPVTLKQLRAAGIDFPAVVIGELELNGYAVERTHDRGRLIGVRLRELDASDTASCRPRRRWRRASP